MAGLPIWIIAFVLALLTVRGYQILQAQKRKALRGHRPELGLEEVDQAKFHTHLSPMFAGGRSDGWLKYDSSEALNPTVVHQHTSAAQSAQRLVKRIASLHDVAIFISTSADQATDNERILLDIFETLKIQPKIVDVSSDKDMYLGLPQSNGQADLHYLYISGNKFGNITTILDACRNGDLIAVLANAGVTFDNQAAIQLTQP